MEGIEYRKHAYPLLTMAEKVQKPSLPEKIGFSIGTIIGFLVIFVIGLFALWVTMDPYH